MYQITYQKFIIGIFVIVIIIFLIKLYKIIKGTYPGKYSGNDNEYTEHFESILNKLKSNSNNNDTSSFKKKGKTIQLKKKVSFEDLIKETEDIDVNKHKLYNLKNSFFKYIESFNKDKFKNVSGTTSESLEKFTYFKEKFFEIFQ